MCIQGLQYAWFLFLGKRLREKPYCRVSSDWSESASQKKIQVIYNGCNVGDFIADLIINDVVIVELKSVQELILIHEMQLVNYLKATNKPVGLLINFGPKRVEVKRKVKDL